MLRKYSYHTILFCLFTTYLWSGSLITGKIIDKTTRMPVSHVNVMINENTGTMTGDDGRFSLVSKSNNITVTFTHIGYEPITLSTRWTDRIIELIPRRLRLPDITISASRSVEGVTPVSFSSAVPEEISLRYSVSDAPMILSSEPGIHAYSESGNGTGYSYLSIRGFDQSRIAVMLDNVSLNDNESHQVYWVDHGDILSDASVVEIQRGIGNSLYGAASFGGSINVVTRISNPNEKFTVSGSIGSYNTGKYRAQYFSREMLSGQLHCTGRFTLLQSDGYRQDSRSDQYSFFGGIEYQSGGATHQFRTLIGKEISRLLWDGVSREMVDGRITRRGKMDWTAPFTDNFLQQIYSLNSFYPVSKNLVIRNTAYLVTGDGFYEVIKTNRDFYTYNLDVNDIFTDDEELAMSTDLLRRKWIANRYYGITPVVTIEKSDFRFDIGAELRKYSGRHFGEVSQFSNPVLSTGINDWYRYYSYDGNKFSSTLFLQAVWNFNAKINLTGDIQFQRHKWTLIQEPIGHFTGIDISAKWNFFNPRLGFTYKPDQWTTLFGSYGTAQKEPSDEQIIKADDVWDVPKATQPEKVYDTELGFYHHEVGHSVKLNYYHMTYKNEIISDIYDFEDSAFDIVTADATIHQGIEFEIAIKPTECLTINMNGSVSSAVYHTGTYRHNQLPNVPKELYNLTVQYSPDKVNGFSLICKFVGRQFIESGNQRSLSIDPYVVTDLGWWINRGSWSLKIGINNVFDTLYETYGYDYQGGYYWPGATRDIHAELKYTI